MRKKLQAFPLDRIYAVMINTKVATVFDIFDIAKWVAKIWLDNSLDYLILIFCWAGQLTVEAFHACIFVCPKSNSPKLWKTSEQERCVSYDIPWR